MRVSLESCVAVHEKKTWMQLAAVEAALVTEAKMMADAEQTPGTRRKSFELAKLS